MAVKKFVYDDLPLFHNVEFKSVPGAEPNLLFLNAADQAVEEIGLALLTQEECNDLLIKRGFYKKENKEDTVPEEYLNGPYIEKDEL